MPCDNFNVKNLVMVICSDFLNEYIGENGVGKTKPKDYIRVYIQDMQQPLIWDTISPKFPIWPKTGIFGKFHLKDFFLLIKPYYSAKFGKKSLKPILRYNFGTQMGQIAHLTQKRIIWKFNLSDFYLLSVPCHAAKFEINPYGRF